MRGKIQTSKNCSKCCKSRLNYQINYLTISLEYFDNYQLVEGRWGGEGKIIQNFGKKSTYRVLHLKVQWF